MLPTRPAPVELIFDILFEVVKRCDWRDVYTIRKVSKLCFEITKLKEVWVQLLESVVKSGPLNPLLHHLERPIDAYSADELEETFEQWVLMRSAWRDSWHQISLRTPRRLHFHGLKSVPPFIDIRALCFIVPGGRWLVQFLPDGSGYYHDLAQSEASSPRQLIPPTPNNPSQVITVFQPFIVQGVNGLKFITGTCRNIEDDAWRIDIYEVAAILGTSSESVAGLSASRVVSFFRPPGVNLLVGAQDLQGDTLAVLIRTPECDRVAVVNWRHTADYAVDPVTQFVLVSDLKLHSVRLLPFNRLLATSRSTSSILDYSQNTSKKHAKAVDGVMSDEKLKSEYTLMVSDLSQASSNAECSTSSPYTLPDPNHPDRILVRQLMLVRETSRCIVYGIEFAYGPNTSYRSTVYKFGGVSRVSKESTAVVGYECAVLPSKTGVHTALVVKWPIISEQGDVLSEGAMNVRSVVPLPAEGERRRATTGNIFLMDEGTGRVLLFDKVTSDGADVVVSELF